MYMYWTIIKARGSLIGLWQPSRKKGTLNSRMYVHSHSYSTHTFSVGITCAE